MESDSDRPVRCGRSHTLRHTRGRRGKPAGSLGADRPPAPALAASSPRPPTHREDPTSSPWTGPRCPERGLPVLPAPPAAASRPIPAPPFPLEAWGSSRPAPRGSSRSSGLAGPLGSRWVPTATISPAGRVLRPPQPRCCPLYPAPGPPGRGAPGAGRPACALHPRTWAFSRPGPLNSVCLGPSVVTVGGSHLAAVTPSPGHVGPSPAPRTGQPAVGSVAAAEMGPRLPSPPGRWGLLRATAPLVQSQPARPLRVGVCGPQESTEGSPQPAPQCPRPQDGRHTHLCPPWGALRSPALGVGGARLRMEAHALCVRVMVDGKGGRLVPSGCPWPAPTAQGLAEAGGSAVGGRCPEAQEAEG